MAKTKHRKDRHNNFGRVWSFKTPNFLVSLMLEQSYEKYDGDDEDGAIQADLDSGALVMFDSAVTVEYEGAEIGRDYLGGSVYKDGETLDFLKGGYFRDMLATACNEARDALNSAPKMRGGL